MAVDRKFVRETSLKAVGARSLAEAAYDAIRHDVLNGALEPGSKLRFEMLRQRYAYGSSTLREALTRLVGESLVTSEEQRGFRVAPISLEDLADLTKTRIFIENKALEEAIRVGNDDWEAGVVAAYHRLSKTEAKKVTSDDGWGDEMEERNRAFHLALVSACPSRWLNHLYGFLFQQSERYRRISRLGHHIPRDTHAEHQRIFDAVMKRDAKTACEASRQHIEITLRNIALMFSSEGEPFAASLRS